MDVGADQTPENGDFAQYVRTLGADPAQGRRECRERAPGAPPTTETPADGGATPVAEQPAALPPDLIAAMQGQALPHGRPMGVIERLFWRLVGRLERGGGGR